MENSSDEIKNNKEYFLPGCEECPFWKNVEHFCINYELCKRYGHRAVIKNIEKDASSSKKG